jgi:hypothetical protein
MTFIAEIKRIVRITSISGAVLTFVLTSVATRAQDKEIKGFGVIEKTITNGAEPVFQSDGYRIQISSNTQVNYHGNLNSLSAISTNTWIKYTGTRGKDGEIVARKADFFPAREVKRSDRKWDELEKDMETYQTPGGRPAQDSLIDADGHLVSLHTKVRMSDAGGMCGWHKVPADQAIQQRVRRVGERIVPAFQRNLAADDAQKIFFRFYAVDESKIRSDLFCNEGLVLVPRQMIERLENDDQLAALLADGVAFNLQARSARLLAEYRDLAGIEMAGYIASAFVPGVDLATGFGAGIAGHEIELRMQEQRGRIALSLMADAGYDPWQAPETWRRLEPKHPAKDPNSVKYPRRSDYQLEILSSQYKKAAPTDQGSLSLESGITK